MTKSTNTNANTDATSAEVKTPKSKQWKKCTCYVLSGDAQIEVGCGADTRARFAPGHDAKTKSTLQTLFRKGETQIEVLHPDGSVEISTVADEFKKFGWEHFMTLKTKKAKKVAIKDDEMTSDEPTTEDFARTEDDRVKIVNQRRRTTRAKASA